MSTVLADDKVPVSAGGGLGAGAGAAPGDRGEPRHTDPPQPDALALGTGRDGGAPQRGGAVGGGPLTGWRRLVTPRGTVPSSATLDKSNIFNNGDGCASSRLNRERCEGGCLYQEL